MKPRHPLTQSFEQLPGQLPLYVLENALLPGGELPLELSAQVDLALFLGALRTDQLIGLVQPRRDRPGQETYQIGCAGRIRQYRERKDGRLNIMLTGICRYRITERVQQKGGYTVGKVDWHGYENDYETEVVDPVAIADFQKHLRTYFDRHNMQVDWKVLEKLPIEQVVNNLVLVMNLGIETKQLLLEAAAVSDRMARFTEILTEKEDPILSRQPESSLAN